MATIKDVARHANVSFTTVSHVINETRPVAVETAERVRAAISELGYLPSDVARALKSKRTRIVGMIVTTSTNPFFAEVTGGVERACFARGYSLMLCNTDDVEARLDGYLDTLFAKRIDGLVVMTTNASQGFLRRLVDIERVPVVAIDAAPGTARTVVNDDSDLGGRLVGRFLAERGFTRIGCLAGPEGHPRVRERLGGFTRALGDAGLSLDPALLLHAPMTIEGGSRTASVLASLPADRRPDVLFCFNDLMAIGALRAAHDAGLRVPDDLSIVGYDDIEFASHTIPPLTTVRQPTVDIGGSAARLIIDHLETGGALPPALSLPPSLVVRGSVRERASAPQPT
ncbi:MAG TPA: LacI family DNA-binding transcriptional regulator [Methylomirabilota bacterium]|nr:LacI family DNA-binding transcriptional regulator [Methylomirabilota bacterium]